jgi:hypothetical protein
MHNSIEQQWCMYVGALNQSMLRIWPAEADWREGEREGEWELLTSVSDDKKSPHWLRRAANAGLQSGHRQIAFNAALKLALGRMTASVFAGSG